MAGLIVTAIVLGFGTLGKANAVAVNGAIIGEIDRNQNTVVSFKLQNNYGKELKNVVIWIPSTWTIAGPGHNKLIRTHRYGPWSTVVRWNGSSLRRGYNAFWFKSTTGTQGIPADKFEKFPLTLKNPTNVKTYSGYKAKIYWQADDGKGNYYRGTDWLVIK